MGVVANGIEQVAFWGFQDEGWDFGVTGGEVGGEGGSDADAVGNDLLSGNFAGSVEIVPGGFGVLGHTGLIGMGVGAVAVAAVVEGEDVDAEVVESGERGVEVCKRAVSAGEKEDGGVGVTCAWDGWNPTSG